MEAPRVHACLEATGGYEEEAALYLLAAQHVVSVVNPRRIHAYAKAQLQLGKTDRADAALIARFCERERPEPWQVPPPAYRQLRHLTRGLDGSKSSGTRPATAAGPPMGSRCATALDEVLKTIEEQIAALEAAGRAACGRAPGVAQAKRLLLDPRQDRRRSGIRSSTLRAPARPARGTDPAQLPLGHECGGAHRLSKLGNARLRRALFFRR